MSKTGVAVPFVATVWASGWTIQGQAADASLAMPVDDRGGGRQSQSDPQDVTGAQGAPRDGRDTHGVHGTDLSTV